MYMWALIAKSQLSLNFELPIRREKVSDNNFHFYPQWSTIMKDSFSIKLSYLGRSYILKWKYRIATIKAFADMEDKLNTIWFVELDNIYAYRWFMYSRAFVSSMQKNKLTRLAEKILANPSFNPNLAN